MAFPFLNLTPCRASHGYILVNWQNALISLLFSSYLSGTKCRVGSGVWPCVCSLVKQSTGTENCRGHPRDRKPGEQRFCGYRGYKEPMGLPFPKWSTAQQAAEAACRLCGVNCSHDQPCRQASVSASEKIAAKVVHQRGPSDRCKMNLAAGFRRQAEEIYVPEVSAELVAVFDGRSDRGGRIGTASFTI